MPRTMIESLEPRCLLSGSAPALTAADVQQIISQASATSLPSQAIVVVDRDGNILGIWGQQTGVLYRNYEIQQATQRARTAAFFESTQDAFTTRTARFIIQDHFPQPVANTPGGPLYGVEFSSLPGTDVLPPNDASGISGNPGGIPLFIGDTPVGGIGVAGTNSEVAPRADLTPAALKAAIGSPAQVSNPNNLFYTGTEEYDFNEAVAQAGAIGFAAPDAITADTIFVGGLRLPFTAEAPATAPLFQFALPIENMLGQPINSSPGLQSYAPLGKGSAATIDAPASIYPTATIANTPGSLQNASPRAATNGLIPGSAPGPFGIVGGSESGPNRLTRAQVLQVISQAVVEANTIRAAIRNPIGVSAKVYISVVDTQGNILGVFRMGDATNFSFDVSVQKARTAAYFSSDAAAFSTRAIGFLSQQYFPPGIGNDATGPLFDLQNALSLTPGNIGAKIGNTTTPNPIANGITIFPGGFPLYENGHLVGAIGVSGDGVDQDDIIAYTGATGFQAPAAIQSDQLPAAMITTALEQKVSNLQTLGFNFSTPIYPNIIATILTRLEDGLFGIRLPYAKFPRNPNV